MHEVGTPPEDAPYAAQTTFIHVNTVNVNLVSELLLLIVVEGILT
jgi:hypothetical protein